MAVVQFVAKAATAANAKLAGGGASYADSFNRADNASLGPDWEEFGTGLEAGLEIVSNQVRAVVTGSRQDVRWSHDLATNDNWASVDVPMLNANGGCIVFALCRYDSAADTCYAARLRGNGTPSAYDVTLFTRVAGAQTQIGFATVTRATPTTLQNLRVEANGTAIRVLLDGVPVISVTDSTITTGKRIGMSIFANVSADTIVDNFAGGDLVAGEGFRIARPVLAKSATASSGTALRVGRGRLIAAKAPTSSSAKASLTTQHVGSADLQAKAATAASAAATVAVRKALVGRSATASSARATTFTRVRRLLAKAATAARAVGTRLTRQRNVAGKSGTATSAKAPRIGRVTPISAKAGTATAALAGLTVVHPVYFEAKLAAATSAKAKLTAGQLRLPACVALVLEQPWLVDLEVELELYAVALEATNPYTVALTVEEC